MNKFRTFNQSYRKHRSSHQRCSMQKGILKNTTKFTGKHLCQSFFFNKVADLKPATSLKKELWNRCFPVNFVKFLRTPLDDCFYSFNNLPFMPISDKKTDRQYYEHYEWTDRYYEWTDEYYEFFYIIHIITFTRLNANNLQSPGNLN